MHHSVVTRPYLSKVVRVTGYVLDESGHFDKSGIELFHGHMTRGL